MATGDLTFDGGTSVITATGNTTTFNNLSFTGGGLASVTESIIVSGDFNVSNNTRVAVADRAITINGNFDIESGSEYVQNANTTNFSGASAQTLNFNGTTAFYNVIFSNGGANAKTVNGNLNTAGNLYINNGSTVSGAGNHTIGNNFRVDGTCNFSGNITMNSSGAAYLETTNVSPATVNLGTAKLIIDAPIFFRHTTVGSVANFTVSNDVDVLSDYLVINNNTTITGQAGNTLKLDPSTSLYIRGANNFPAGFGTFNFDAAAWVRYDASFDQTIKGGFTYGQLMIDNPGTKTVDNDITITGQLYVSDGAVFDLGNFSHTFTGTRLRSEGSTRGIIEGTNSTLTIVGDLDQSIEATGTNGYYQFGDLILSLNGATQTRTKSIEAGTDLRISGNLTINNIGGTAAIQHIVNLRDNNIIGPANNLSIGAYCELQTSSASFGTDVINSFTGTKLADVNSTLYYSLGGAQQIASGLTYGNIELNGGDKTAEGDLTILGNISRVGGTPVFYDNGGTHIIRGNWLLNNAAYYTAASATGTIVFDGADQDIDGVNFNNLVVSNSGQANIFRDITIFNDLTVDDGSTLNMATENLTIGGNFLIRPTGVYQQTSGYTTFNGADAQTLTSNAASQLGFLTINKTISPAQTVTVLSELHITRNTNINTNAGVLDIMGQDVYFGDNLYIYENLSASNFIASGSTAYFNGSASQNIRNYHANDVVFNNIEFSGADKQFEYSNPAPDRPASRICIVNGNFTINGSVVNGNSFDFYIKGNWQNNGTFQHGNSRTVYFDNTIDQTISSSSFGNVVFEGDQNKTLTGAINVSNNLTIDGTANLNADGNNITVGNDWFNNTTGTYTHGNGKVIFNSGSETDIYSGTTSGSTVGKNFYAIDFNKSNRANLQGDLVVETDFSLLSNQLRTNSFDVYVGGNFVNAGSYSANNSASTLTLNGSSGNTYTFDPNDAVFRELVINASGATYNLASDFSFQSVDMNLMAGSLNLNENTISLTGSGRAININGGTLNVNAGSTIQFTENQNLNLNTGILMLVGEAGKPVSIENTHTNANRLFRINANGGVLHALHYQIQKGIINIAGASSLDAVNNLSSGTFTNGYTSDPYLTLDIDFADFSVSDLIFNSGAQNNVYRPTGHAGVINIQDASGGQAGEVFENDVDNQVDWTFPSGFFWDGGGDGVSWNDAINWDGNTIPGAANIVYLNHDQLAATYNVNISTVNANCRRLNIDTQGGNPISVTVGSGRLLDVDEHISMAANTTLSQADNTALINVGQNWTNLGTFNHGNSTVTFDAAGGNYIIATGGVGAGKEFYNLTINAPTSTYTLDAPMEVSNNLTITDGTLDLVSPNNDLNVGGNWLLDQATGGVFIPSTADVTFDGNVQAITNGTFYNVNVAGTGTKTLNSNIAIENALVLNTGTTLDAQDNNLYVRGNWTNNGGTYSQSGLGAVIFDRTGGNQQIDNGSSSTTFNNITFYNSSTKTFYADVNVNGNVTINSGSGSVNLRTFVLTGVGGANELTNNAALQIEGASNFPTGFETLNIATAGEVRYYSDGPQDIYSTSYFNLRLRSLSDGISSTKTALGNLDVKGNLYIDGNLREATLDMAANDANIVLTGGLSVSPNSGFNWGTGTSTMEHIGGDWNIDGDVPSFNNLMLSGSGDKALFGNMHITGDLTVKSNVDLELYRSNDRNQFFLLTGEATGTFTMETAARTLCARPNAVYDPVNGGLAYPEGFGTYAFNENSNFFLYSPNSVPQTLYTGISYGFLSFRGTKDVTSDGVNDLTVRGDWDIEQSTYYDGGKDTYVGGANVYLTRYTPSSNSRKIVLNGLRDQRINDDIDNTVVTPALDMQGTGVKTIGDGNDVITIDGDFIVAAGLTATSNRNITFNGANWNNNGIFNQTNGSLTFSGTSDQTIYAGPTDVNNYFRNLYFSNSSVKTFITNGADINGFVTINDGTVDLGALSYAISGSITNTAGGTLTSISANIEFDGGSQNINTPAFSIYDVTCSGTGSKYLYSDWTINGNLLINAGTTLNTRSNSTDYDIYIKRNWTNHGTFIDNSSTVTFDGSLSTTNITSGGSNFYDVEFAPTGAVRYQLLSADTRFTNVMTVGVDAELDINGKELYLGRDGAAQRVHTVNGTLTIDEGATLFVNNQSQSTINIENGAQFNIIGGNASNVATLSSVTTASNRNKTLINVRSGATLAARYYLIEYVADAGINMELGSTLDPVNNFSDGTWLGMRNVQDARYLILEADYAGGNISNIAFNYNAGVPLQGRHYNVQRINATVGNPITFDNVSGSIGSYRFEEDELAASDTNGKLRWPAITETYWTGAVDVDWHVDGNWDNGVPSATIDAIIPDVSATTGNNPFILNDNAECKSLVITDGRLRMENDYDLTTYSDVSVSDGLLYVNARGSDINVGGDWLIGTHGNYTHGGATVNFVSGNGSVSIAPGDSEFNNIAFNNALTVFDIAASSLTVEGNVLIENGTVSPSTNNYRFDFKGNYQITGGSFNTAAANGVIALSATADQVIADAVFDELEVSGSNNKLFNGTNVVNSNTTINSSLIAQAGSSIDFKGDMNLTASGTFNDGGESHTFNGVNWYGDGTYSGSGTITFNRTSSDQNLYAASFNNLVVDCTGEVFYLREDVNVTGDVTFKNGIDRANLGTNTITSDGTGDFIVENAVRTYIYGTDNFPKSFANYNIDASSNTYYDGSSDQTIAGVSYGHLRLNNTNTKTLGGNTEVKGNLYVYSTTLDVGADYQLSVGGSWYNNSATPGHFICRNGEVVFNGSSNQLIYIGGANTNTFYDLTASSQGNVQLTNNMANDFVVQNALTVTSGTFDAEGRTVYVGGDMLANASGQFTNNTGTYYLNKASGTANISLNGSSLQHMTINSGATYTILDQFNMTGSFNLQAGTVNGNGNTVNMGNGASDVINIDGTYIVGPGGVLGLGNGSSLNVSNTGRIEVVGNASSIATVSHNTSGGRYAFSVEGEIAAEYYLFEYMSNTGIYLLPTSTIDATNHFSNGTFSNGTNSGQLFRVENTQSFTDGGGNRIENVSFPNNPGGSASNVAKYTAASGTLEFYNSSGVFAGETYDNDPGNLINWTGPVQLTWNGSVSTDWNTANNWTASSGGPIVPTAANNVIIANATNQPILSVSGQQTGNLIINSGSEIRINTADAIGVDLDVNGDMQIDGTLRSISSNDNITVEGNWTRGTTGVVLLNGNVTFDGVGGAKIINNRGTSFQSLTIGGTAQYQLGSTTTINDDVIINAGSTFDLSSSNYTLTVNGDWINNGTLNAQQRKVIFSASSGSKQIQAGSSAFYNLDINAPGVTYTLTSDLTANEVTNVQAGTIYVGTNTLSIGDGSGTDEVNIYGTLLINEGATLDMANNASLIVNTGGEIELLGTDDANRATLTSSSAGRYSFDISSGGSIKAQYYQVDYVDADGLYMHAGAIIDATNNLSDGIFSNGAAGGTYMTLLHEMGATETLSNLTFNAGPAYCVTRTSGTTVFEFEDASGALGNYLFEKDDEATPSPSSGLLRWPFVNLYTWEGDVSNDWFDARNWYNDVMPDAGSTVTIPATGTVVIDNSNTVEVHGFDITSGGTLTLEAGGQLTTNGDINTADGFIIQNTNVSPASYISNGNVNGNVTVEWTNDNLRWWFIGHAISNPLMTSYDVILPGNDYAMYDYQDPANMVRISKTAYDFTSEGPLRGYIFKVKNTGAKITHTGTLNASAVYNKALLTEWQVIANPYPSYYQLPKQTGAGADFEHTTGSVYVTVSTSNDDKTFDTFNTLTGIGSPETFNGIIAPSQAFYVKTASAGDVYMRATNRLHDAAKVSLKSVVTNKDANVMRLKLFNGLLTDEAVIALRPDGAFEHNRSDSEQKMQSGNKISYIYSIVDDVNSVINVLPNSIDGHSVDIGIKAQEGEHEFYIEGLDQLIDKYQIELEDKLLDVKTVIDNTIRYRFTTEAGTFDNRFELHFTKTDVATGLDHKEKDEVKIFIDDTNKLQIVCNWEEEKSVGIYSLSGRQISFNKFEGGTFNKHLTIKPGLYLVKILGDSRTYEHKTLVK